MEGCPKLLDLIPSEREWLVKGGADQNGRSSSSTSEPHKLELRLGPPGEHWPSSHFKDITTNNNNLNRERKHDHHSLLSLVCSLPNGNSNSSNFSSAEKGSVWFNQQQQQGKGPSFFQSPTQRLPVIGKESSQPCCTKVVADLQQQQRSTAADKKAFSLPPPTAPPATPITAVPNTSQKRTAPGPVVGWPPIRSFRKNLASSSASKPAVPETHSENPNKNGASESPTATNTRKGLFKKINMDGIPIGRKVDLNAYDSYEKLASAVDELFRGLLAAQSDSCAGGIMNKEVVEEKPITGLLDGSGEYTLVYEDNEGDRMLVGDVPWHMFASTVKRLRVLKSSEVSALSLGSCKARVQ